MYHPFRAAFAELCKQAARWTWEPRRADVKAPESWIEMADGSGGLFYYCFVTKARPHANPHPHSHPHPHPNTNPNPNLHPNPNPNPHPHPNQVAFARVQRLLPTLQAEAKGPLLAFAQSSQPVRP